ncbi:40378_t:CDS:2, partial [Gigaspora margarita]
MRNINSTNKIFERHSMQKLSETSSGPLPTTSSKSSLEALKTTSPIQLQDHPCEHTKDYRIRGLK